MAEEGLPRVKKSAGDETAKDTLKGSAGWFVSEIDPSVIDPDGLYLPRDPREVADEQQDRVRGSKDLYQQKFKPPFGAVQNDFETDISPRADNDDQKGPVSKHAAANRDHSKDGERNPKDITDEYLNKKPSEDMLESMSIEQLEKLLEAEESGPFEAAVPEPAEDDLLTNVPPEQESQIPDEEYNSAQDDEVAVALDTFEHAQQHWQPKEGPIEEILPQALATSPIKEAAGKGESERFFTERPEVLKLSARDAYTKYKVWAAKKGIDPAWWQTFERKHAKAVANGGVPEAPVSQSSGPRGKKAPAPVEPRPAIASSELESEFGDVLGPLAKASNEQLAGDLTVDEKYDQLISKIYDWAITPMEPYERDATKKTSGSKRHMMICGSPGVGKTFSVKEAVLQAVNEGIDFKTQYVRGTIGKSISNVMAFLYRFRQGYLIIFDDCDDFLDSDLGNVMKGVFELDAPSTNTGSVDVRKRAAKNVLDLEDQPLEENTVRNYILSNLYEGAVFDEEDDDEPLEREELDTMEDGDEEQELLPARINFQSRILFISNKKRDRIDSAVRSRLSVVELYLSAQEIIGRIREIFPQLLKNEKSVSADRLAWAKTNALRWLELTVKANGQPIEFPGGRTFHLPFEPDQTVIEFRTYIDLVSGWLAQARKYERQHKGVNLMTMQKLPMDFLRGFLVGELVPILHDASSGR